MSVYERVCVRACACMCAHVCVRVHMCACVYGVGARRDVGAAEAFLASIAAIDPDLPMSVVLVSKCLQECLRVRLCDGQLSAGTEAQ